MEQNNILLYFGLLLLSIALMNGVTRYVVGAKEDPMVLRAKLCHTYYEYLDRTNNRIEDLEKMCWRTERPPDTGQT